MKADARSRTGHERDPWRTCQVARAEFQSGQDSKGAALTTCLTLVAIVEVVGLTSRQMARHETSRTGSEGALFLLRYQRRRRLLKVVDKAAETAAFGELPLPGARADHKKALGLRDASFKSDRLLKELRQQQKWTINGDLR